MKKLLTVLTLFMLMSVANADSSITVNVDSVPVSFDVAPRIISGRTMVPVRAIFEALGAEVDWNGETRTVTATNGIRTITMTIGKPEITVGESYMLMDTAPIIVENRTLIPARFAAEAFGNTVSWDGNTRTVNIISGGKTQITYYKKYDGAGIHLMYPADWLLDESYPDTVFIDNQPAGYSEHGLGLIAVSAIDYVNSSFDDTVSVRYDYLVNDCDCNITEFKSTAVNGNYAQIFRYTDAEGDYVVSYFIAGSNKSYYVEFITDHENGFSDIFADVLSTIRVD